MKKVIAIFSFVVLAGATQLVQAQEQPQTPATEVTQEDEMVKITVEELPEAVKEALASNDYQSWTVSEVFHNKTKDTYKVVMKNGAEETKLKFNRDGSPIEKD